MNANFKLPSIENNVQVKVLKVLYFVQHNYDLYIASLKDIYHFHLTASTPQETTKCNYT